MRTSGRGMDKEAAAFLGEYIKNGKGGCDIDTDAIDARMKEYFEEAGARRPPFDLGRLKKYCK